MAESNLDHEPLIVKLDPEARSVTFEGETVLKALSSWLLECRNGNRPGSDYFRLVDAHNAVLGALRVEQMPVHQDFTDGYKRYQAGKLGPVVVTV